MKRNLFFALFAVLMLTVFSLKATIVYTDIADGQPATIDMDNDGTAEFTIINSNGHGDYITYITGCNIIASGTTTSGWDEALAMQLNDPIGATGNFIGAGDCAVCGFSGTTTFPLNVDRYLGVRFKSGSYSYYGWIRVYVTGTAGNYTVTYKDYAYENTPWTTILAGNKPAGINETFLNGDNSFRFCCTNQNNINIVAREATNTINTIQLYSVNGQLINTINPNNSPNANVDINELTSGVYLLVIFTENKKNFIHKFVK